MKVKRSIAKSILYWLIPIISCFALIMTGFWIVYQQNLYDNQSISIRNRHIDQNKLMVKREVQSVVNYIDHLRAGVRVRLENEIKDRTYEAYTVAMDLYNTYHDRMPEADVRNIIKQSLRSIRYNNGRGYYFATNFNGIEELFADHPEMEGKNLLALQDVNGKFVISDMIQIARQSGEGFYEYAWSKPSAQGHTFPKIAFVKHFEPYDWFIGTGEYLDDVEKDVKEEVLIWLNELRFGEDSYIGAFTFDGARLAFPVKEELGANVWDFTDANGVKVVQEGIKWSRTRDGGFVEAVSSIKPATGKSGRKISYFMGVPDWQWAISTGVYLDEVDEYIENKKALLHDTITRGSLYTVGMFFFLTLILVSAIAYISRKADAGFQSFISFFDGAADGSTPIDASVLSFSEFEKLAVSANRMVEERHHALEALRKSEEKLRAILDFSPVSIALTDFNGRIEYVNRKHIEWFGYSLEEIRTVKDWLLKAHPSEADHESILSAWMSALSTARETGKDIASREITVKCRDGSSKDVTLLAAVVSDRVLVIFNNITDRKRAEKDLRESEEKYRQLIETTGTGYVILDDQGRVTDANLEYAHLTGRRELEDVIGHGVLEWTAPHDFERNAAEVRKCLDQGFVHDLEIDYVTPSGRIIPIEINATVLRASGALRILTLCRDITERRRAEEERKAHIHFLESLEYVDRAIKEETDVEQMLSGILNTVFSIFDCDRAWLLYPCDPDAPSFRVPVEITRPEYPGAGVLDIDIPMTPGEALNMREALDFDEPVIYTAGTERPISTGEQFGVRSQMFVPVHPKLGKPWVFGMHQCSYPRIWTKEEIKLFKEISRRIADGLSSVLSFRELLENEERFRATFEQAAVGIAHVAPNGRWLRVNRKLCDIVGYSREELLQKTFHDITYPEDLAADTEYVRQVLAGEIQTYSTEKRYIRKDASLVWINLTVSILRNTSGDPTYFIFVIEDVTGRRNAEEEKHKLRDQLLQAQKMESVGRLAGGVAHDFNNMLSVILGYAEMALMNRGAPSERLFHNFKEIQKAALHSADLVRQLLAFARRQIANPKILDLNETIENMLKMLRRLIGEDIDLVWMPGRGLWHVKIDPSQIDQVLANLTINARDAIIGVGSITIETENVILDDAYCAGHAGFVPGDYVQLAVSDTGAGMDEEVLDHLFEPFFTTKDMGRGTGLGLATVYGIVKQNEGLLNVYSEPGKGATFKIYLPRFEPGHGEPREQEERALEPRGGTETILLVEDDESVLQLSESILLDLGYKVIAARSPNQAIRHLEEHTGGVHLLITDVVMPEMNGRELAERLKALRTDLRCLFMSGYTANVIAHRGILDKNVHFIHKPFSRNELALKVREVLEEN